jgi:hypothetical protein
MLDTAKKNLTLSMTVLKRFQMLGTWLVSSWSNKLTPSPVNALEQLDGLLKEKKYGDMAQTLGVRTQFVCDWCLSTRNQAVKQIATFFRPYTSVDRIASAWKRIQEFQGRTRTIVEEDFDAL